MNRLKTWFPSLHLWQRLSFLYLTLPLMVFAISYVNNLISMLCIIPLLTLQVAVCFGMKWKVRKKELMLIVLGAAVLSYLSGVSGYFYQVGDHGKHNLIISDLFYSHWPVLYKNEASETGFSMLTYYLGYYLVPVSLAKMMGFWALKPLLFIWTTLGLSIVIGYSSTLFKSSRMVVAFWVMILVWGGVDIIPWLMQSLGEYFQDSHAIWFKLKDLTKPFINKRTIEGFQATMQHSIPMTILICAIFDQNKQTFLWLALISIGVLFWSPFAGILGIIVAIFKWQKLSITQWIPVAYVFPFLILLLFYFTGNSSIPTAGLFYDWELVYWLKIVVIRGYHFVLTYGVLLFLIWRKRSGISASSLYFVTTISGITFVSYFMKIGQIFISMQMGSDVSINFTFILSFVLLIIVIQQYWPLTVNNRLGFGLLGVMLILSTIHNTSWALPRVANQDAKYRENPKHFPTISSAKNFGNISALDLIMNRSIQQQPIEKIWENTIADSSMTSDHIKLYDQYISPYTAQKQKVFR